MKFQSLHPQSDEIFIDIHFIKDQPLRNRHHCRCCHSLAPRHGSLAAAPSAAHGATRRAQRAQRGQRCSGGAAAGAGEGGLRITAVADWVLEMDQISPNVSRWSRCLSWRVTTQNWAILALNCLSRKLALANAGVSSYFSITLARDEADQMPNPWFCTWSSPPSLLRALPKSICGPCSGPYLSPPHSFHRFPFTSRLTVLPVSPA